MKLEIIRNIGELHFNQNKSNREIANILGIGAASVSRYLKLIKGKHFPWETLEAMDNKKFKSTLLPQCVKEHLQPDFEVIYSHSGRKITTKFLYENFYLKTPAQEKSYYSYQRFCALYQQWLTDHHGVKSIAMIPCSAAELCEIDFSGDKMIYINNKGEKYSAEIFVACLRYSKLMYAEAMPNQSTKSWLLGTRHAFEYFNGVTHALSIDNAKPLVNKADRHVAQISTALKIFAKYYNTDVLSSRVAMPRDKQSAEYTASEFQEKIQSQMMSAGYVRANSLEALNLEIIKQVNNYNERPFTNRELGTRRSLFELEEKDKLKKLPLLPFDSYTWSEIKADKYHRVKYLGSHRFMVMYYMANKSVIVAKGLMQIIFYDPDSAEEVGRYNLSCLCEGATHDNIDYMSDAEKALRRGCTGMLSSLKEQGYSTVNTELFIKNIYEDQEAINLVKYRRAVGFMQLCKKYGVKLVNEACEELNKLNILDGEHYDDLRILLSKKSQPGNEAQKTKQEIAKNRANNIPQKSTSTTNLKNLNDNFLFSK